MKDNFKKKNVVVYIDGSNLYFSVKNTFDLKIDIEKFCKKLVGNNNLVKINFYIAPVNQKTHPRQYTEQQKFFDTLRQINKLNIIFGRLEKRKRGGEIYYVEKASDVNFALDLVLDAQKGIYDEAYLISNDGDFSGAVTSAINFGKKVIYIAIGNRKSISHHLKKVASRTFFITKDFISECKI
ncbi:MAG: NYN domain-containing protein [Nanoarchaeota archaeon]